MRRTRFTAVAVLGAALLSSSVGCVGGGAHYQGEGPPLIAVPPPGAVPTELGKITLPPYVIEAPDILLIEVVQRAPEKMKEVNEKGEVVKDKLTGRDKEVETGQTIVQGLPVQPISSSAGGFNVRSDGSVLLGIWGQVTVSGLTLDQAAEAIRNHLLQTKILKDYKIAPENLFVIIDVLAYNSKRYHVIADGAGNGEQVQSFPVVGSETVLDAISNVGGLGPVASKRNIWVARRTPHSGQHWQIMPVDWVGITQHGVTTTNYQLMPGDRVYVKAQRLISIDNAIAKVLSPIERVFGITLLGASSVNQIQGRGAGFGNTGN
jgi:polysaccharide export outer membrane protein